MSDDYVKRYAILVLLLFSVHMAFALTLDVTTDKTTYNYGDYLTVTITVSEVSDSVAIMHIVGPDGVKSSAIPVQIKDNITSITTPNAFDPQLYKEGRYQIHVTYTNTNAVTEFEVVDAGNVFLPFGSNLIISQWVDGIISDYNLLKFLSDNGAISINPEEFMKIPQWYKNNAGWWLDRKITDLEFLNALQYLIDQKII
jgi:hypothetical protein